MSHVERRKAVEQFRLERRGFFGIVDPGPCIGPPRDTGIDKVDLRNAQHGNAGTEHPEGNVHSDETEVDWRALLHPAGAAEEHSTDTGSGSDQGTDDEEALWKQTWHGGAILRDG
eukprot:3017136-Pyramimonas_sp.AAC.1